MALISKASLLMVPSTYEEGTLYNVLPSGNRAPDSTDQNSGYDNTRADFTFDRGSNAAATRIGSDGLIKKYRENKLLQSNQFDTTWARPNSSVTSGQSGYDGSNDAWLLSATANFARIEQTNSSNGVVTLSVYAKAGTADWIMLRLTGSGFNDQQYFDLANGTIGINRGCIAADIEDVGGGWYRCSATTDGPTLQYAIMYIALADGNLSPTNENIYIQNAQLESGMVSTDVLTSGATTAKAGVLIDLPRINYDANGENGSLLLEPSRQQLVPYSELFSTAVGWSPQVVGSSTANVILNYGISPDGYQNADRLQLALNGSSYADWVSVLSVASGTTYTYSVYAKSLSGNVDVKILGGTPTGNILKEITTEWTRLTHTFTATSTALYPRFLLEGGTSSSADILVFGAMLEAGSYATSYIPNHGTTGGVTRAADSCSVTGVSDVIGQTEGTIFVDMNYTNTNNTLDATPFRVLGSGSAQMYVEINTNETFEAVVVNSVGTLVFNSTSASQSAGRKKMAIAYKGSDFAYYINGTQIAVQTSGAFASASLDSLRLGMYSSGVQVLADSVNQATIFNERLSNAELATLTTL